MARTQIRTTVHDLFRASLPGRCFECRAGIRPGDSIGFLRGYVACRQCKEGITTERKGYL